MSGMACSEQHLQRKLDLAGCVLRAKDAAEVRINGRGIGRWVPQIHVIEGIEELRAELKPQFFPVQSKVLEKDDIPIPKRRATLGVAT
jgi:hypothetical protein